MLTILTGISKFSKGTYKQPLEVLLFETKLYPTHKGTSQYTEESSLIKRQSFLIERLNATLVFRLG